MELPSQRLSWYDLEPVSFCIRVRSAPQVVCRFVQNRAFHLVLWQEGVRLRIDPDALDATQMEKHRPVRLETVRNRHCR